MYGGRGMSRGFMSEEEKKNSPKVTGALIKRIFGYLSPYKKQLALTVLCIGISSLCSMYPSVLTGRIIDEGLIGRSIPMLVKLILLSLGLTLGGNLIGVAESYLNAWIAQHITYDMRNQMFRHLERMSQRFFLTEKQGDLITRMTGDISGVESVITGTFTGLITNVSTLIIAIMAMFRKNALLALIGIAIVPLFTLPTRLAGKRRWSLTREAQKCDDEINGILNETLSVSGQLLVKLFGREEYEYERYKTANGNRTRLNIKERMAGRWFFVVLHTFTSIGPMLLYLVGGILMMKEGATLTVGDITVLVALLGRMYGPVNNLMNMQVEWIRAMAMFTRIFEYLDRKPDIENAPDARKTAGNSGEVRFEHVDFSYTEGRPILRDVTFDLKKGRSIAIVGPSGAGKSTVVNLIPRLWDVDAGRVLFEGEDVRKLDLNSLRQAIGVVTQETYLFNGTIRDNLLYAAPDATEEEMISACKRAHIWEMISARPEGLDTLVGNRGLKLSGGEKQRISIARVLLKDPALLIFDEATSALDSISESLIQEAIDPLIQERTSILIAHRLSTILAADEILVMEEGRIAERGTHEELVGRGGTYTRLYETQFRDPHAQKGE